LLNAWFSALEGIDLSGRREKQSSCIIAIGMEMTGQLKTKNAE